ncbi:MAG: type I glyceraldehyde-3-phosphate dehydrogenase [Caldilineae bacterium]|nr:type I glyceraldehyde-3-phosphate dehydrogenase [Chloroflexota bacterium]MCB9176817.1 type I glyceraldehyde-3-phosphate dehydrogenase [Caldilineae bacterium]
MSIRVAINGFGRIGEMVFRSFLDEPDGVELVAINDLISLDQIAYLLRFDSVHRTPEIAIESGPGWLRAGGREVKIFEERDPAQLPWAELGVDVVVDATGVFRDRAGLSKHLAAGARKVVLTAPAKADDDVDLTVCLGVNHDRYDPARHQLVSNASCTTNCLAPVARAIDEAFGLRWGVMSTIHAYTGSQALIDRADKRLRRGRAAAVNIVPTSTGAAKAIGLVLPQLDGRLTGMAYRVPVPDGSVVDLTFQVERPFGDAESLNAALRAASEDPSYRGVLSYNTWEIVSSDIVGTPWSSIFDATLTSVVNERTARVVAWYDNEFGYGRRVHDLVVLMGQAG